MRKNQLKSGPMLLGVFTLMLFILVALITSAHAQTIAVRSALVIPGDTVSIPIEISGDVTDVYGFQLDLEKVAPQNTALLRIKNVYKGDALTLSFSVDTNPLPPTFQGMRIGASTVIPAGNDPRPVFSGPGAVFDLEILVPDDATQGQVYDLNLNHVIFAGPKNQPIDLTVLNGSLTIGMVTALADTIVPTGPITVSEGFQEPCTVTVTGGGQPVPGVGLLFSMDDPSIADVSAATVVTGSDGKATINILGIQDGTTILRIVSPGLTEVTVEITTAGVSPVITSTPPLEADAGDTYTYAVNALDPQNDTVTYHLIEGPSGMAIDRTSGVLSWAVPASPGTREHEITIEARDPSGNTGTQTFTLLITVDADSDNYDDRVDCDDNNADVNPGATEIPYDGIDNDCNPDTPDNDLDGDGSLWPADCDDSNPSVNPSAAEIFYNGIDDDCNPATADYVDNDGDGYCSRESADCPNTGVDCNDNNPNVNPGVEEIKYNGINDDCDPATLDSFSNAFIVSMDQAGRVYYAKSQGNGTFTDYRYIQDIGGYNTRAIAIADFDNDGDPDFVAGGGTDDKVDVFLFLNNGNDQFLNQGIVVEHAVSGDWAMEMGTGDFNHDGRADFAVSTQYEAVVIGLQNSHGEFDTTQITLHGNTRGLDVADINWDGHMDIVCGNNDGEIHVYPGNGDGTFAGGVLAGNTGGNADGVTAADFDGDGLIDIIAVNYSTGDPTLYKNNGDGSFTDLGYVASLDTDKRTAYDGYDFDNDGKADVIAADYNGKDIWFYPGNGDGTFGDHVRINTSDTTTSVIGISAPPYRASGMPYALISPKEQIVPLNGTANLDGSASHDNDDGGTITSREWNFGDGSAPESGETAIHTYGLDEDIYNVTLKVTDNQGKNDIGTARVIVQGAPPSADAGGPYSFDETSADNGAYTATLDGSGSFDTDSAIVKYEWDFGDGWSDDFDDGNMDGWTAFDGNWEVENSALRQTVTGYGFKMILTGNPGFGDYDVEADIRLVEGSYQQAELVFRAHDPDNFYALSLRGGSRDDLRLLRTSNGSSSTLNDVSLPFNLEFDTVYHLKVSAYGDAISFYLNGNFIGQTTDSTFSKGQIGFQTYRTHARFDNVVVTSNGNGPNPTHKYAEGTYTATLTVTDKVGQTATDTAQVDIVPGAPPIAVPGDDIIFTEADGYEGTWTVFFDGSGSSDDVEIISYEWDFGDGTTATGTSPSHVYEPISFPATYTVTITVTDNALQTDTAQMQVTIDIAPNSGPSADPGGPYAVNEEAANAGLWTVNFDGSGSTDDRGIARYEWDFGDGSTLTIWCEEDRRHFLGADTSLYGYDIDDDGLYVYATQDDTDVRIINLETGEVIDSTTLDQYDEWGDVGPGNGIYFKVEADKPVVAYQTYKSYYKQRNHATFIPSLDQGTVGKEFIFYLIKGTDFFVFAVEDALVRFYQTNGTLAAEQRVMAGSYWSPDLSNKRLYHVVSSGRIAMQTVGNDDLTTVPATNGKGVGTEFYCAVHAENTGALAVFAYDDADVTVSDLDTGETLWTQTIATGDAWLQKEVGTRRLRIESTGDVEVWAGDIEEGINAGTATISDMGDDISFAGGREGKEFYIHGLRDGLVIFAPYDGTMVNANGLEQNLDADGFLHLAGGAFYHITATQPVVIQTLGLANDNQDVGTYLGGICRTYHEYDEVGTYNVTLTVYDHAGQSSSALTTVTVEASDPPDAQHGGPYAINEGSAQGGQWQMEFTAGSSTDDYAIYRYDWDFDDTDGIQVDTAGMNPTHSYTDPGTYTVTLRIYDHALQMTEVTTEVTVEANNPPIADADGHYELGEEVAEDGIFYVAFDGTGSTDDFGIFSYEWDFDDALVDDFYGTTLDETRWMVAGDVTRDDMLTLTGTGEYDETYCFSQEDFEREGGNVFTCRMRFNGGGSGYRRAVWGLKNNSADYNSDTHFSYAFWIYNNYIRVKEDSVNRDSDTIVRDEWYDLKIVLKPVQGAIYYYKLSSDTEWIELYDSDHITYATRFKVGCAVEGGTHDMDDVKVYKRGIDVVSSHAYNTTGNYEVTLTVQDHALQETSETVSMTLSKGESPHAEAGGPYTGEPFSMIRFNGTGSTDDTNVARYEWDFGDGHTAQGASPAHFYREDGSYTVMLTVFDNVLQSDTTTTTVTIGTGTGTVAEAGGPYAGGLNGPPVYFDGSGSSDDSGILKYTWTVPIIDDDFSGDTLNTDTWNTGSGYGGAVYVDVAEDNIIIQGRSDRITWGSGRLSAKRSLSRKTGSRFSGRVKPETGVFAMGWKDNTSSYVYNRFVHAFRFNNNNEIIIQEDNNNRGVFGTYTADTWYELSIELKNPGARYFINGQLVYESAYSSESILYPCISAGTNLQRADELKVELELFGEKPTTTRIAEGTYSATLAVEDGSGQTATDTAFVQIVENMLPKVICVPWVGSDPKFPHETWNGKEITLKGVVKDADAERFQWNFGDGTSSVSYPITDTYDLSVKHVYPDAPNGTPFVATLTVWDTNGETGSDTYNVIVKDKTLDVEINVAIDEALWNLHIQQDRSGEANDGRWQGAGTACTTASALQAFQINTHMESNDPQKNPYAETVARGMYWLLNKMQTTDIEEQTYGNPDSNGNGIAIGLVTQSMAPYEMGMVMMALAASGTPLASAHSGPENVNGRLYYDILTDMVDLYSWGQTDYETSGGGWQYRWNNGSDNSACQWAALGMESAEEAFNIPVPQWVKDRNLVWLKYSTGSTKGIGYGYTGAGTGIATSWGGLAQVAFDDISTTDWRWIGAQNYVASKWDDWSVNTQNYYALYAMAKALRIAVPREVTVIAEDTPWAIDWFRDPERGVARTVLDDQLEDGSFCGHPDCGDDEAIGRHWLDPGPFRTAWGVVILSQTLFVHPPVADAGSDRVWGVDIPLTLDGSESYHTDPFRSIVLYEWDVNSDGSFDTAGPEPASIHTYLSSLYPEDTLPHDITVTLRVTDDNIPAKTDMDTVTIIIAVPPHPPVADPGGPYIATAGVGTHIDGSGSFDIDPTDTIFRYGWELDGAYPYDFDDGEGVTPVFAWDTPGTYNIGLKVWDNGVMNDLDGDGEVDENERLTDVQWTTITVVPNLPPTADAGGPYTVDEGISISLDGNGSSDPNGDPLIFSWDLDNDGEYDDAAGATPDHIWMDNGTYTISLEVSDSALTDTGSTIATVNDLSPSAAFIWSPEPQAEGAAVSFTDGSTSTPDIITGWAWDFGGLGTSNDQNPSFTFDDDGIYTVTITVTDDDGSTDTASHDVTITDKGPVATLSGDTVLNKGQSGNYDAGGSVSIPDAIVGYEWDWDYDSSTFNPSGDTGVTQSHAWTDSGVYTAAVRVTDDDGSTDIAILQVTVNAVVGPTAVLSGDASLNEGQSGSYDATASTVGTNPIERYAWDWNYNGSTFTPSGDTDMSQSRTWADDAIRTIAVRVIDTAGMTDIAQLFVVVHNVAPDVEAGPDRTADEGDTVSFSGSFTDPGTLDTHTITWDFGDGTTASDTLTPSHVFNSAGTYAVTLTVKDDDGATGSDVLTVTVESGQVPPEQTIFNLAARAKSGKVQLTWRQVDSAQCYNVYRSTSISGHYSLIAACHVTDYCTYLDPDVVNNTAYFYVVRSVANGLESLNSNEISITPQARQRR